MQRNQQFHQPVVPPNSPDLSSSYYKIWREMQHWAYTMKVHDINELKHFIWSMSVMTWDKASAMMQLMTGPNVCVCVCVCVFMPNHVIWFNIFNFMLILWKLEAKWCYCVKYDRILLFLIVLCISQEIVPNCLRYSGKYKIIFLQIHHWVPSWKNFKYRSIFANAMHMVCFFFTHYAMT